MSKGSRSLSGRSEWDSKYNRSEKGRERYERYRATEKGRTNERHVNAAHRRREREARIASIDKELNTGTLHREG